MIVEFSEQSRNSTNHRVKSLLDASRLSNAADATAGIERWALALRRHLGD